VQTLSRLNSTHGSPSADGGPRPFHLYSRRQVSRVRFILIMLKHYMTCMTSFSLARHADENP
jgi:type I restriction enzyme R subunit